MLVVTFIKIEKMIKRIILVLVTLSQIISCGSEPEKKVTVITKEEQEKIQKGLKEKEKLKVISELTSKYNIAYNIDTVRFRYSIDCEPILKSKYLLTELFFINDIFKIDSIHFVTINVRGRNGAIGNLTFPISKEQIQLFTNKELVNILVVHISEIKKIKFVFKGEVEDEEWASVSLANSTGFTSKGELIEIVSLKK